MRSHNVATNNLSVLGKNWQEKFIDERQLLTLQQRYEDLGDAVSRLLCVKNIELDDVEEFLNPSIKTSLPNPFELLDMDLAVSHIIKAVKNNKKITIFADYDVDGATSSSLLKRFFADLGVDVGIYVPDRILEGYGPNAKALVDLKKQGTDLVITVDCGTVAFEPLQKAHEAGLDIIVIDHHIGVTEKPKALAVINPNRIDENFEHKNICGATVSFLVAVAVNKQLREEGFYQDKKEPNLMALLDLVALGTVCDVMPLTGLNRALVSQGLKILKQRKNVGIRALFDVADLDETPSAYHLGFVLGPRINAGGRVGKSDLGANLLASNCEEFTGGIAEKLNKFNIDRKEIEINVLNQAIDNLENGVGGFSVDDDVIFAASYGWHPGVIGIVASRLKDKFGKPVAVISLDDGKGKASCRSIKGVDFGGAILQARMQELLIEGGGHAMAGGFSVKEEKIADLHKFFNELLAEDIKESVANEVFEYDLTLDLQNVNIDLIKSLQKLEPYGVGNAKPKFMIRDLRKLNAKLIGKDQDHISCQFSALTKVGFDGNLPAVAFRAGDTKIAEVLLDPNFKKPINVIGDLSINSWMGREKVQLIIEDIIT